MRKVEVAVVMALLLAFWASPAAGAGAIDVYQFESAADEARYRDLIAEFRCPKCLNTNLAGSNAAIAEDLRRAVHRLVTEGATDQEIRDFLRSRYGTFVLYDPPLEPGTVLLWFAPGLFLLLGIVVIARVAWRSGSRGAASRLSADERRRLAALTGNEPSR